jgi:CHAT domain-containing protein/predicted negative regulator of RcsB-dependent stress response
MRGEAAAPEPLRGDALRELQVGSVDGVVATLIRSVELAPDDARSWSDLAAVRLERATLKNEPSDFVLALSAATRALAVEPGLLEARFNEALALEHLSLPVQARTVWDLYDRSERDPHWRREARAHRDALPQPASAPDWKASLEEVERAVERRDQRAVRAAVASSPQRFREYLEEEVLVHWAEEEGEHREVEAGRNLDLARDIGDGLIAFNGERTGAEIVARIDRLKREGEEPRRMERLVQGLRAYGRGLDLSGQSNYEQAMASLQAARELLTAEGSPFAGWAGFRIALCHYQRDEYETALKLLRSIQDDPISLRSTALQGRSLWLTGLIQIIQGNPAASLTTFGSARENFRRLKEPAYVARIGSLLATNLDYLGREDEAWRTVVEALREPATLDAPKVRFGIGDVASLMALEHGEFDVALWFQEEVLRNAKEIGDATTIAVALQRHASILGSLGKRDLALRDLEQARRSLGLLEDLRERATLAGDLFLTEGELACPENPRRAITLFDRALSIFRATAYHYRLRRALYQRALAEGALGLDADEERDLADAITESEQQRKKITSLEERIAYFDQTKEMIDTMIRLQLERRGQIETALAYSERSRSRALLDWILAHPTDGGAEPAVNQAGPGPETVEVLRESLPPDTVLIEIAVLPENLVLWAIRRSGVVAKTVGISSVVMEGRVRKLARAVREGRSVDAQEVSEALYRALVQPVASYLPRGCRIVFIPDGLLHTLPFSLLRNGRTGKYLIQDHSISVAPSATIFTSCLRRSRELAAWRDDRALVVTDPAFDQDLYPSLSRLKGGETEQTIAKLFPGSRVLDGQAARKNTFLAEAGSFGIIHFGGHAVINPEYPLISQLLFASDPADRERGVLYSGEILGRRFPRTRLAVLASCGTALGHVSRTEGVESLARPFLAAGLPGVVASLWNVDDESTAEFFVRFYGHLKAGLDVAAALQATQVESIDHGSGKAKDPASWGAFELIGDGGKGEHSAK